MGATCGCGCCDPECCSVCEMKKCPAYWSEAAVNMRREKYQSTELYDPIREQKFALYSQRVHFPKAGGASWDGDTNADFPKAGGASWDSDTNTDHAKEMRKARISRIRQKLKDMHQQREGIDIAS